MNIPIHCELVITDVSKKSGDICFSSRLTLILLLLLILAKYGVHYAISQTGETFNH